MRTSKTAELVMGTPKSLDPRAYSRRTGTIIRLHRQMQRTACVGTDAACPERSRTVPPPGVKRRPVHTLCPHFDFVFKANQILVPSPSRTSPSWVITADCSWWIALRDRNQPSSPSPAEAE